MLFCDLVGFTSASENADPEDVQARLAAYHSMLRTEIERFAGTVEKFIGDAVMAVFGAPIAHEDDPERAVRAGLRIIEAITELNEQQRSLDLQVRVGINTGEALVNLSAHVERGEGFVTGDVVNTASRLQGAAPVHGVVVGEHTYALTKDVFDYVELPAAELKGKADKVRLFHARAALSRFGTDLTRRHTTPLVGREIDLALLKGAFDKALSGPSLQLVTVVGEPGVGKSRLVTELFNHVDALPELVRFRQGRCLPYGEGITFWAIGEIVKAEVGVLDTDDSRTAKGKLQQTVERLVDDPAQHRWFTDRLSPLLGLQAASPETRDETFTVWRRFLEAAAQTPLVCVIEDVHWADQALLDFIEHVAEWSEGVPLLVVCTARPELFDKHPHWGAGLRNRVDISLAPLSDTESARLVSALLGAAVLPAETQQLLVERAGGNPLYAEEFVRMLSDRQLLDETARLSVDPDEISFPATVQAIIAARLDTLSAERKAVLQDASVIGKVFWAGAVAALSGRDQQEIAQDLHELSKKELVRRSRTSTVAGELECSFWHAHVRDVAYGGIPRAPRAAKHNAAAQWLEDLAGERAEDYAEILAYHYLTALDLTQATSTELDAEKLRTRARRHLLAAAVRTLYVDVPRTEKLLRTAMDLTPLGNPDLPTVEARLAQALNGAGRYDEAQELYQRAITEFDRRGDVKQRAHTEVGLALVMHHRDPAESYRMTTEAIAALEQLPPGPELVNALRQLQGTAIMASHYAEGVAAADRVLQLLKAGVPIEEPRDIARADALHNRGGGRFILGDLSGLDDVRAAIDLAPDSAFIHNNLGYMLCVTEGPVAALQEVQTAITLATAQGMGTERLGSQAFELELFLSIGQWDELLQRSPSVISEARDIGDDYALTIAETFLAHALLLRGARQGWELVPDLLSRARRIGHPQVLLPALLVTALATQLQEDHPTLAHLLEEVESAFVAAGDPHRALYLPAAARLAVSLPNNRLAATFVESTGEVYPASTASLASTAAVIAETTGDLDTAVAKFREGVDRWTALQHLVERTHSLLGLGRTRLAAGDPAGADDLGAARDIWSSLHARPLIAEADRLLGGHERLTS